MRRVNMVIDTARDSDAEALTALINRAFLAEAWFAIGDRITVNGVRQLLGSPAGTFFVARDGSVLVGCVWAERRANTVGYIGLLAIEPDRQGAGLGPALMAHAEQYLERLACQTVEITVVNIRTELLAFYARRGYQAGDTLPFPRPSNRECHLVRMTKAIGRESSSLR